MEFAPLLAAPPWLSSLAPGNKEDPEPQSFVADMVLGKTYGISWWSMPSAMLMGKAFCALGSSARGLSS